MSIKQYADLDMQTAARMRNLPAPLNPDEPVRLSDLNSAIEGLAWKDSVRVATQANLNLASPGASIDGVGMAVGDRVLVRAQTAGAENGIYIWNGAAVPMSRSLDCSTSDELEQATTSVEEGTSAGVTYRQTLVNFVLGTGTPAFATFGSSAGAASETSSGIAELATQAETDAGTDDLRIVTPYKLANWSGKRRTKTSLIGDNSATQFDITHNWGTRSVIVQVNRAASPYDTIACDITRPDVNTVRLNFVTAPTANQFEALLSEVK